MCEVGHHEHEPDGEADDADDVESVHALILGGAEPAYAAFTMLLPDRHLSPVLAIQPAPADESPTVRMTELREFIEGK